MEISGNKVITDTANGIKWSFIVTIISIPISLLEIKLISNFSLEMAGFFALIEMFFLFIMSIFTMNSQTSLSRLIPSIKEKYISSFINTFFLICILFYIIVVANVLIFENYFITLLKITHNELIGFITLGFFALIFGVLNGHLRGSLQIKKAAIFEKAFPIIRGLIITIIILFFTSLLTYRIVFLFVTLIVLIILDFILIKEYIKKYGITIVGKLYLPEGFWSYISFTLLTSFLVLIYDKADQLIITSVFDQRMLGIYFICIKITMLIKIIPRIVNTSNLPSFTKLLYLQENTLFLDQYRRTLKNNILVVFLLTILVVSFSNEILDFFNVTSYSYLLIILAIGQLVSAPTLVFNNLFNAIGKTNVLFYNSVVTTLGQLIVMSLLINKFGVYAFVIGKVSGSIIGQVYLFKKIKPEFNNITNPLPVYYYYLIFGSLLSLIVKDFTFYVKVIMFLILLIFIYKKYKNQFNKLRG
ncbi:polysaccharide biosynthesis C-terminal domain-containing protein [Bacillus sp. N1-1]|uniref:lipopolysaccharide biosynthesis protein n=1 Tax=Bacillus sp. N1-1 TaxID=2682541 RepID=UPI001316B457|nr:polysaccharide biosynthesis C-terminal domain-containing protein [Bacillus sp. N1-1]QHA93680.1 hypothetical protein GNK04_20845 [Bacillus sp. N1-1]